MYNFFEDLGEAVLEAPVVLVAALEEEAGSLLRDVGEEFLFLLVCCAGLDVGHGISGCGLNGRAGWARIRSAQAHCQRLQKPSICGFYPPHVRKSPHIP